MVLDFYPQGKSLSQNRAEDYNPLAVVVTSQIFQFFDVIVSPGMKFAVSERLMLTTKNKKILRSEQIQFNHLSTSALDILPEVILDIVFRSAPRFMSFLNEAHPLTTQMHQLQLLPGIGQKRLWTILGARKNAFFSSFADFTERTGISDPASILAGRIFTELEGTPKYRLFTEHIE